MAGLSALRFSVGKICALFESCYPLVKAAPLFALTTNSPILVADYLYYQLILYPHESVSFTFQI